MRTSCWLLLALSLSHGTCLKDSPVAPEDNHTPQTTPTVIIGPSGGTISCDGFSLMVPAAAFSKPETLTVKEEAYDGSFGTSNITKQYRLVGLPISFTGQIQVTVRCSRTPSTGVFLAVGSVGVNPETGEAELLYEPVPATPDSGCLKVTLKSSGAAGSTGKSYGVRDAGEEIEKWFLGFDGQYTPQSSGGHFRLFCPLDAVAMAQTVAQILEDAYGTFDRLGLNRTTYDRVVWPINVGLRKFSDSAIPVYVIPTIFHSSASASSQVEFGLICNGKRFEPSATTQFRKSLFQVFSLLFAVVHDSYFNLLNQKPSPVNQEDRLWPYFAFAAWASARSVSSSSDPLPELFVGRMLTPLRGVTVPQRCSSREHGVGMVALMKYLADTYGEKLLGDIYHSIPSARYAVDVLVDKVPEPEYIWWPAFMKQYLKGEIYGVPVDTLLQDVLSSPGSRLFTISSPADTLKYFNNQFPDLSAKLYRVNLRYAAISPNASITFEVGPQNLNMDYITVLLYGLKDHKLEYWGLGNTVLVKDAKALTDAGYDIVAAVVNSANTSPYTGSLGIELKVSVQSDISPKASFRLRTNGIFTYEDGRTTQPLTIVYGAVPGRFHAGSLVSGLFTTQWDTTNGLKRNKANWEIRFNMESDPPKMTYFKVEEVEESSYDTRVWKINSAPSCQILGQKSLTGGYLFRVVGTEVGRHLLPVQYYLVTPPTTWWQVTSTLFDADSYIEVILE